MILGPFSEADVAIVRAVLPADMPLEPRMPTAIQAEVAAQFLAVGVRLPLRISPWDSRVIVDADGDPVATILPTKSRPDQERCAVLLALLPNVAAGVAEAGPQPIAAE